MSILTFSVRTANGGATYDAQASQGLAVRVGHPSLVWRGLRARGQGGFAGGAGYGSRGMRALREKKGGVDIR